MKIQHVKEAILLCREANVTPFIMGHRGIGKSSVVKQTAQENGLGFVDLRASQLEASDIRGLPDRVDGRTVFCPPADLPVGGMDYEEFVKLLEDNVDNAWQLIHTKQANLNKGILFLDELNRAADDVIQAVFQLVLDRAVGQYVLPPGWCIVVAGNFMEGYMTNGFNDPAFLDRFCHITMADGEVTMEEWVDYITDSHGEDASTVVEYATQNVKHLDGDIRGERGFRVEPSRRSWEAVIRIDRSFKQQEFKYSEDARQGVIAGLVGTEIALAYTRYNCPVKPRDLINNGVKAMEGKLGQLNRNQLTGLMWGLSSILKGNIAHNEKYGKVAVDFIRWICKSATDKDIVVAFCNLMNGAGGHTDQDRIRSNMITNPKVAHLLQKAAKRIPDKEKRGKAFIQYINDDPELQDMLAKTAVGNFIKYGDKPDE